MVVIVAIAVVGGILGLANLLIPRPLMLLGQRWTLRDGDRAEPSDLYVLYVRVSGAIILAVTAVVTIALGVGEHEQARKAELEALWDVTFSPRDGIEVITDPRVSSAAAGERQVVLSPTRTAVVGRDALGDLGVSFEDGELLVGMGYSACTFDHLRVTRDGDVTTVGIVMNLPPIPDIPGLSPPTDAAPSPADTYQDYVFCTRRFGIDDDAVGLTVFRVPDAR